MRPSFDPASGLVLGDVGVEPANIPTAPRALAFMLAGNATFTLRSLKTMARFTYNVRRVCCDQCKRDYAGRKVQSCKKCSCHLDDRNTKYFVSVLTGSDNERDYSYMGMLVTVEGRLVFTSTRNSKVGAEAPSYKAFTWTFGHLQVGKLSSGVEIWHAGKCGKCGRKLTVPSSIAIGIGPECLAQGGL